MKVVEMVFGCRVCMHVPSLGPGNTGTFLFVLCCASSQERSKLNHICILTRFHQDDDPSVAGFRGGGQTSLTEGLPQNPSFYLSFMLVMLSTKLRISSYALLTSRIVTS